MRAQYYQLGDLTCVHMREEKKPINSIYEIPEPLIYFPSIFSIYAHVIV